MGLIQFIQVVALAFILGALPIVRVLTQLVSGKNLAQLGTGNVGVSAAFYHGGTVVGVLAVISEALKGVAAVWIAQQLFPQSPAIHLLALCFLVLGRYFIGRGAGTTNVVWGVIAYNWRIAFSLFLFSAVFFIIVGNRQRSKLLVLFLLPLIIAIQTQDLNQTLAAMILAGLLGWIYTRIQDDLDLPAHSARHGAMFKFLKGSGPILSLDQPLNPATVGSKAANLSQLKQAGYSVPPGWVLLAGDDPAQFAQRFEPDPQHPLVARSSAVGEDTQEASAAGQYETVLDITSSAMLLNAIATCQDSFDHPAAVEYRDRHQIQEAAMAVLVQPQIQSVFSGVAFSRDPLESWNNKVVIEGLPGFASSVVSGQKTPETYAVCFDQVPPGQPPLPEQVEGEPGDLPLSLVTAVADLARRIEATFQGVPQDVEWTYDGQTLWVLQARPITTLLPIWTRKIAAEVIPGIIPPLTWSINQPLTCSVWGRIFQIVLGSSRSADLDFQRTADLHYGRAYFNASLLGKIFLRMGLPPESLEFLTRGAPMTPPRGLAVLRSLPGLLRLVRRSFALPRTFKKQANQSFQPVLAQLEAQSPVELPAPQQLARIQTILETLDRVTYFQILVPLTVALRQKIAQRQMAELDQSVLPEVAALQQLHHLAQQLRQIAPPQGETWEVEEILECCGTHPTLQIEFEAFLQEFGYLSEVATDISVPTWREDPQVIAKTLKVLVQGETPAANPDPPRRKAGSLQRYLNLKGQAAQIYNRLLAHLRWTLLAIADEWVAAGHLTQREDIFLLTWPEIEAQLGAPARQADSWSALIASRQQALVQWTALKTVPTVLYGAAPPLTNVSFAENGTHTKLVGIGASAGEVEGIIQIIPSLQDMPTHISREMVLVVPFTDAGWAPIFAQAGGIIAEVGGKLSHGAILAREYGIPAVMDVEHAIQRLHNGQRVRINGGSGVVELLSSPPDAPVG
ncbi:glycerol-3-phosphate acyltransferase [Lyngbya confervoides]|uniref:Glycerol-3-phosphate acyltransferase n=1 Tax=Lyngbya confervoides BDU141951 TaxID=1574623 RepID=A0ABD4T3L6_9CYAN|nr:glycerol-3-phosphate acyltransferase [Lyngbya confervoides]MCM1983283.1 glycerol-3-phosphate acyltransferase [Lyngbya confervoides BDU141951]